MVKYKLLARFPVDHFPQPIVSSLLALICYIILSPLESFSHKSWLVFHWSLSDRRFPRVTRTRLGILTVLKCAVVWMNPIPPPISCSLSHTLGTVPSSPTTFGINVTLTFRSFLISQAKSEYLSLFSLSLIFTLCSAGTTKFTQRLYHNSTK